jgi:hypothetical protein
MIKFSVFSLCIILLSGCTYNELVKKNSHDINRGYFSDASECSQSAMRKEELLVPTGVRGMESGGSVIEIPIGYDANTFIVCMEHAGRPVSQRVDVTEYLKVSTDCLHEARESEHPDKSYASCIKQSRLKVEVLTD